MQFGCNTDAFHRFGQAKFAYGGPVLGMGQFLLLSSQLPQKMMLMSKVVISRSKSKSGNTLYMLRYFFLSSLACHIIQIGQLSVMKDSNLNVIQMKILHYYKKLPQKLTKYDLHVTLADLLVDNIETIQIIRDTSLALCRPSSPLCDILLF